MVDGTTTDDVLSSDNAVFVFVDDNVTAVYFRVNNTIEIRNITASQPEQHLNNSIYFC